MYITLIFFHLSSDIGNFGGETSLSKVKASMEKTGVALKGNIWMIISTKFSNIKRNQTFVLVVVMNPRELTLWRLFPLFYSLLISPNHRKILVFILSKSIAEHCSLECSHDKRSINSKNERFEIAIMPCVTIVHKESSSLFMTDYSICSHSYVITIFNETHLLKCFMTCFFRSFNNSIKFDWTWSQVIESEFAVIFYYWLLTGREMDVINSWKVLDYIHNCFLFQVRIRSLCKCSSMQIHSWNQY